MFCQKSRTTSTKPEERLKVFYADMSGAGENYGLTAKPNTSLHQNIWTIKFKRLEGVNDVNIAYYFAYWQNVRITETFS